MSTATPAREVMAAVRIGRGTKIHPALVAVFETAPGQPWNRKSYSVRHLTCSCPNAANGSAAHSAALVAETTDLVNCGGPRT